MSVLFLKVSFVTFSFLKFVKFVFSNLAVSANCDALLSSALLTKKYGSNLFSAKNDCPFSSRPNSWTNVSSPTVS